jgi:EH domain-containing protein 1
MKKMKEVIVNNELKKLKNLKKRIIEVVDKMMEEEIDKIMDMINNDEVKIVNEKIVKGGEFEGVEEKVSKFG